MFNQFEVQVSIIKGINIYLNVVYVHFCDHFVACFTPWTRPWGRRHLVKLKQTNLLTLAFHICKKGQNNFFYWHARRNEYTWIGFESGRFGTNYNAMCSPTTTKLSTCTSYHLPNNANCKTNFFLSSIFSFYRMQEEDVGQYTYPPRYSKRKLPCIVSVATGSWTIQFAEKVLEVNIFILRQIKTDNKTHTHHILYLLFILNFSF